MCGSTFLLGLSGFDHRNAGKISFFLFLSPLSLSLSLSIRFPLILSCLLPLYLFFFPFLHFLSTEHPSFLFAPPSHFHIFSFIIFLLFLSFSLLFLFLHFLFSISHLDCINRMFQKWGKLPPTFFHCHLSSLPFFLLIS